MMRPQVCAQEPARHRFRGGPGCQRQRGVVECGLDRAQPHCSAFKPLDFPLLAATDIGQAKPGNQVGFLFQNAGMGYTIPNIRVDTHHVAEPSSAHLRSPGRIENSFANEGFMDELAQAAGSDPAEFRPKYPQDARAEG